MDKHAQPPTTAKKRTVFVLYDGRAKSGRTDDASVLDTAGSEREARRAGNTAWKRCDAVWFEYDFVGGAAVNERMRADLPPKPMPVNAALTDAAKARKAPHG